MTILIDRKSVMLRIMHGFDNVEQAKLDAAVSYYASENDGRADRFAEAAVDQLYELRAELELLLSAFEQSSGRRAA